MNIAEYTLPKGSVWKTADDWFQKYKLFADQTDYWQSSYWFECLTPGTQFKIDGSYNRSIPVVGVWFFETKTFSTIELKHLMDWVYRGMIIEVADV